MLDKVSKRIGPKVLLERIEESILKDYYSVSH